MNDLPFSLERTVVIHARRATVFRFFTDPARFARWWGDGSTIDARVGGAISIRYPDGSRASGEVRALEPDRRIVFTYGYDRPDPPIAPGGSLVTITLDDDPRGTRLALRHDVADAATRDAHVQGWRHILARFADVASADAQAGAADAIARWLAAWNDPSDDARAEILRAIASPEISFADANGLTRGVDDLIAHIDAGRAFMRGVELRADGPVRQQHGTALAGWTAVDATGAVRLRGTNVFRFAADGRIDEVIGIRA